MGVEWAAGVKADTVELRATDDVLGWCTAVAKVLHQSASNDRNIRASDSERGGSSANLRDEVANFVGIEHHEFVYPGHARVAHVRRKAHLADTTATQQDAEELVQMGEEAAKKPLVTTVRFIQQSRTYYWFELTLLAGIFISNGAAPPPSRKLTEDATLLTLVDTRQPLK